MVKFGRNTVWTHFIKNRKVIRCMKTICVKVQCIDDLTYCNKKAIVLFILFLLNTSSIHENNFNKGLLIISQKGYFFWEVDLVCSRGNYPTASILDLASKESGWQYCGRYALFFSAINDTGLPIFSN